MKTVKLRAPLNRGKIDATPGETVDVQDGLAARLIAQGKAEEVAPQAEAPAAKSTGKGKPAVDPA